MKHNIATDTLSGRSAFAALSLALLCGGCGGDSGDGGNDPSATGGGANIPINPSEGGFPPSDFACRDTSAPGETVAVPAGEFIMGCNEAVDADCHAQERPMRNVVVNAFSIQKTEVTQAQYTECVLSGSCSAPSCRWECSRADYPAGCLTRAQAVQYCTWAGMRLPTEAEWEKAARGTDGRKYPWGNTEPTCNEVNMAGCVNDQSPVGAFPSGASPYGALDMAGNMVEILSDYYDESYYASAPNDNPRGPASDERDRYVGRGGGWKSEPYWQRTSVRDVYWPDDAGASLGFRCAK